MTIETVLKTELACNVCIWSEKSKLEIGSTTMDFSMWVRKAKIWKKKLNSNVTGVLNWWYDMGVQIVTERGRERTYQGSWEAVHQRYYGSP